MPSYDATDYDPPAPVAQVTLRNVRSGKMVADVPLLLDTGADVTLLPRNTVEQLGVQPAAGQRYELIGFNGSTSSAPVVILDLLFLKRAFRGAIVMYWRPSRLSMPPQLLIASASSGLRYATKPGCPKFSADTSP